MKFDLQSGSAISDATQIEPAEPLRSAPGALHGLLAQASTDLARATGNDVDWAKDSACAAEWLARLVPAWRTLVLQHREIPARNPGAETPVEIDLILKLIDGFLSVLSARAPQGVKDQERQAAIEKAKQEWECTADALTAMVCLLNSDGLILRANRVVEHWGLGSVSGVIGKKAHAVLHPACITANCEVDKGLREALSKLKGGDPQEFEVYSPVSDQTLQFTLRPMRVGEEPGSAGRDSRTVLVVSDVSALRGAQKALERVNVNLESRVRLRTRELDDSNRDLRNEVVRREHAERELRASHKDLALLSEQLIQAQEGERRRIALELHDSVGQSLSAIKYTLERAIIMVQRPSLGSPESVLTLAVQRIHETADGIRAISMNLRPQMLDSLGAASATSWFCRGFAEVYPSLTVRAEITAQNDEIPRRISTHVFRCVQELLNNVAKHAQAKTVWVQLKRDGPVLSLEVRDDGIGMSDEARDPARLHGSGIRNLRERAEMTAGQFSISSLDGRGTSAQIVWRLGTDEAAADAGQ
ncbi:MAG: sensor histidine kinase [Casimicrobiaceae bacterium]